MKEILILMLGAFLGAFLTMFGNRKHAERERLVQESIKFRDAFHDAILNLTEKQDIPLGQVITTFRDQHASAILKFRPYISKRKLRKFDKAVDEYKFLCQMKESEGIISFLASENTKYAEENRDKFTKSIHSILAFAVQK